MRLAAALLAVGMMVGGPLMATSEAAVRIVIGQADKPALLNPLMVPAGGRETRAIKRQIFDALVVQDDKLQPQPQLAESWTVRDGVVWTFKLHQGIKFHNGEPFNAEVAKFNLDQIIAPDSKASWHTQLSAIIKSVEATGEYELTITTNKPAPTLLTTLAFQEIVPKKYYEEVGTDGFEAKPVGTGPFIFVSRDGSTAVLKRNPDYWGGAPIADEVVFKTIPEVSSRIAALKANEIQIADKIPNDLVGELSGSVAPSIAPGTRIYYLGMNVKVPPFDDVNIRRAVASAIDRDLLVKALYAGRARPLNQPAFPEMFGYQPDAKGYTYDPAAAKKVLSAVKTPLKIDVAQADLVLANAVQGFLSEAGLKVEVQLVEDAAFGNSTRKGLSPLFVSSWGVAEGDLDAITSRHFWSGRGDSALFTNYSNPKLDDIIVAARSTTDDAERFKLDAQAVDIVIADAPWAPLVNPSEVYGVSTKLTGWTPVATGIYFLTKATLN
jgi:peptide/nickel transport system substrate-binding protein